MMNNDTQIIEKTLESNTGLKFRVSSILEHGNEGFVIRPKGVNEGLFKIKIIYRNRAKLIAEFSPLDTQLTQSLEYADEYRRQLFTKYADRLSTYGQCLIKLNNESFLSPYNNWPTTISSIDVTLSRIVDSTQTDINVLVVDWTTTMVLLISSLLNFEQIYDETISFADGAEHLVTNNRYERNPLNRKACLMINGYACKICGFDFEKKYGVIGKEFIHVHHLTPVSKLGGKTLINPITDLVPVCPNCHYMLHRRDPPYSIEELKRLIEENSQN